MDGQGDMGVLWSSDNVAFERPVAPGGAAVPPGLWRVAVHAQFRVGDLASGAELIPTALVFILSM